MPASPLQPFPDSRPGQIRVWDLPTRLGHWLLVALVIGEAYTGFFAPHAGPGSARIWHFLFGYGLLALLVFRLIWGFWGPEFSRFDSFFFPPARILAYLRSILGGDSGSVGERWLGHNPAGGAMIFGLLGILVLLIGTGLIAEGGEPKQGPLRAFVPFAWGAEAQALHWLLAVVVLAMAAGHVAGVLVSGRLHRENLILAMITGCKPWPAGDKAPALRPARPATGAAMLAVIVAPGLAAWLALERLPPLGVPVMAPNPAYVAECGACHWPFHPSLLPASAWQRMLVELDSHFGEDATLAPAKVQALAGWLTTFAAEAWDTEAGNRFRLVAADQPLRVTATPFWREKHRTLTEADFKRPGVGGKVACPACHREAARGAF